MKELLVSLAVSMVLGVMVSERVRACVPEPWGGLLSLLANFLIGVLLGVIAAEMISLRMRGRGLEWRQVGREIWRALRPRRR